MNAEQTRAGIEPIVKSVTVSWSPETAFRRFTDEMGPGGRSRPTP